MENGVRNIVRGVSRLVTVGGIVVFARSASHPNPALEKEVAEKSAIVFDARGKYRVEQECYSGFGGAVCFDTVRGGTQEQKDEILAQYTNEVALRQSKIPVDLEAHRQAQRDGLGMLTGLSAVALGLAGIGATTADIEKRKGKQFVDRLESRRGGRKEGM